MNKFNTWEDEVIYLKKRIKILESFENFTCWKCKSVNVEKGGFCLNCGVYQ